jgi:hypothetical protein
VTAPASRTQLRPAANLRLAQTLTAIIILLTAVAVAGGLFIPGLYRDPAMLVPVLQGQDLLTLIALPVAAGTLLAVRRGSGRAAIILLGLLGYLLYTYTGASFAYTFNVFFLLYVALFALIIATVVALTTGIDAAALKARFDPGAPRVPVAVFLGLVAVMLFLPELGQIIPFYSTGVVPEIIRRSGGATSFVHVLDMGVVTPLTVLGAIWLLQRRAWGYILAGTMLIKGATMGLALLSMTWFAVRAGQAMEVGLTVIYALIAAGSLAMAVWFFGRCRG